MQPNLMEHPTDGRRKQHRDRIQQQRFIDAVDTIRFVASKPPPIPPFHPGERVRYCRAIGTGVLQGQSRVTKATLLDAGWYFEIASYGTKVSFRAHELDSLELVPYRTRVEMPLPFDEVSDWIPATLFPSMPEVVEFSERQIA